MPRQKRKSRSRPDELQPTAKIKGNELRMLRIEQPDSQGTATHRSAPSRYLPAQDNSFAKAMIV